MYNDKKNRSPSPRFDPPFYDNSKDRIANSGYRVKEFKPLDLGTRMLRKGRQHLRLSSPEIVGEEAIDVHSVELVSKLD